MDKTDRIAELGYSKTGQIELVVPAGMSLAEVAKLRERVLAPEITDRLPRGCQACISGDHLNIRERFETVLRIDLDSMEIVGQ